MQDDIIGALTQEVKEEVIQNYLYERRLVEEQINHVNTLAQHAAELEDKLYRRFARIYEYLSVPECIHRFVDLIGMKEAPFETRWRKDTGFRKGLRFIRVRGLTNRAKFRRLFRESYRRLCVWNEAYGEAYEDLEHEIKAVNYNVKKFENGYDLLTILNFLKDMDVELAEKKYFLSDNFTPEEMASVEKTLRLRPIRKTQFNLIPPPSLPEPRTIEKPLGVLADFVYSQCTGRIRTLVR
jgi:hypothetical protein